MSSARIAKPGSPRLRTSGRPDRHQQKRPGRNRTDLSFVYLSLPVHPWSKPVDEALRAALFPALSSNADAPYVVAQSVDIKAVSHLPVRQGCAAVPWTSPRSSQPQLLDRRLPPSPQPLVFARFRSRRPCADEFVQRRRPPSCPDVLADGVRMMLGGLLGIDEFAHDFCHDNDPVGCRGGWPLQGREIVAGHRQSLLSPLGCPALRFSLFVPGMPFWQDRMFIMLAQNAHQCDRLPATQNLQYDGSLTRPYPTSNWAPFCPCPTPTPTAHSSFVTTAAT